MIYNFTLAIRRALLSNFFVRRLVSFFIRLIGHQNITSSLERSFLSPLALFHRDGGDASTLSNLKIEPADKVLILGGYIGDSAARFLSNSNCEVVVLEPIKEYFKVLENRFRGNPRVRILNFGASNKDSTSTIYVNGQTTSEFEAFGTPEVVHLRDISKVIEEINRVDILEINIEGGEYEVLDKLLESESVLNIRTLLIQFHTTVENHELRRANIRSRLRISHTEIFNYEYVWERWDLSI